MSELPEDQAPVISSPEPPALSPVQPTASAPLPKSPTSALKVILISFGTLVGVGIIGASVLSYEFNRVSQAIEDGASNSGASDKPAAPTTTESADKFTESDLGIAIYPGAQPANGGVRMQFGNRTMVNAIFLTPDSKEKVVAFYKDKAGPIAPMMETVNGTEFVINMAGDSVTVTIFQSPTANDGKTQISITHNSKGASPN